MAMRSQLPLWTASRSLRQLRRSCTGAQSRAIQISATGTSDSLALKGDVISTSIDSVTDASDARFEVLGAPYSLLSVSLSASQRLYTRRGTLVGVSGKTENAQSTLTLLNPLRNSLLRLPFLYQRLTSTTPLTALISTKSPLTTFTVLHLDGTTDWVVAQRKALLAWTGHRLSLSPIANTKMSLAHWGNTAVTGRGLVALAGPGQIYRIILKAGEEYVAHPGNVVAYSIGQHPPLPYRMKSSSLRFQVPNLGLGRLVPHVKFFRMMQKTGTYKALASLIFTLRTSARRTIWGDRLFLKFHGPTSILLSSRASRISDVLTARDVNEIADSKPGTLQSAVTLLTNPKHMGCKQSAVKPTGFHVAEVGSGGKVKFEDVSDIKSFVR
ncbi:mitochondrial biogenesis AIM24-domain-containing protein [Calycina marina]|uniref:Altered inheritance of mitochondria protein 24, mitochondrial n=1 Tax=Calycina marina TaxID=1763456 RepID=A0A9P7Z8Y3_9HELO|nr:mitochondrial biogenesis AIM24-domain-containing protein [Calycina marina]